jgi:hypothetical protein
MFLPAFNVGQEEFDDGNGRQGGLENDDDGDGDVDDDVNDDNHSQNEDDGDVHEDEDDEGSDSGAGHNSYEVVGENDQDERNSLEDQGLNEQMMDDTAMEDRGDSGNLPITARMLAPSKPNKYQLLLHPLAATFHTGKIVCSLEYTDTGISQIIVKGVRNSTACHGDTVGYQGYLTSVKNMKGAAMLKNISRLGFLEKATFGLMHPSLHSGVNEFQELMDKCLEELENLDLSKTALSDSMSRSFCFRLECFRSFRSLHQEDYNAMHGYSYNVLDIPVFLCHKDKILRNYFNTLHLAKEVITCVFKVDKGANNVNHFDVKKLSPPAKTGIQFLSEILTYDVGTPSGFSRRGPIINSLIATDDSMTKFGLHYPLDGIELDSSEATFTGLACGLDPNHWKFVDEDFNLHDEIIRILGYSHPAENQMDVVPQFYINPRTIDKLRKDLGKRLFRFKTNNKDRDTCTWQLLVSHFILVTTGDNPDGNVFGSVEYQSLVKLSLNNKTQEIESILEKLAHIFWLCYDWEWRTDLLTNGDFRHLEVPLGDWPTTIGGLSMVLGGLARPKNTKKVVDNVGKTNTSMYLVLFMPVTHAYYCFA